MQLSLQLLLQLSFLIEAEPLRRELKTAGLKECLASGGKRGLTRGIID